MDNVIVATPVSIERAFAHHGARVAQAAHPPEICYPAGCTGIELWGGRTPIYFKPRTGTDFMVILFKQPSEAVRLQRLETRSGLGTARRGRLLLLYEKSSTRIAKLRAALAASM